MNEDEILTFFRENWDKIRDISQQGNDRCFYPIILPERDGMKFIDPGLPAMTYESGNIGMEVRNPPKGNFEGLILEEKVDGKHVESDRVTVTYMKEGEVYAIQCDKAIKEESNGREIMRYHAIGLPKKMECASDKLSKIYEEFRHLLFKDFHE